MTRIEAFVALFGANSKTTATQAAVDTIKDNPQPTPAEESTLSGINIDMLDRACEFGDHPTVYVDGLGAGNDKTFLTPLATALSSGPKPVASPAPAAPTPPTATARPAAPPAPPASTTPAVDPLEALRASASSAPGASSGGPVLVPPPGATRSDAAREPRGSDDHHDRTEDRGDRKKKGDRREPPPPPKKPDSSVVAIVRERIILNDRAWPPMRDAIVTAWAANDQTKLARGKGLMKIKLEGVHGAHGELFGGAMRALFQDLTAGLHTSDPTEFRHRFWG